VAGVAADPRYLDVRVPANKRKVLPIETSRHVFAYVFGGSGTFRDASAPQPVMTEQLGPDGSEEMVIGNRSLVLFDNDREITVEAGPEGFQFLLVSGKPIGEPVAWRGPIVMNTQEQLVQAYRELQDGTFIKP
jgi:hypothetical protein